MRRSVRSERGKVRRAVVVGSGVAGMTTALHLCQAGVPVSLVSVGRGDSCAIKAGFAAGDVEAHVRATLEVGGFLANEPPVRALGRALPSMLDWLDRAGVAFERSAEGGVAITPTVGAAGLSAAHVATVTGLAVSRALDEQLRPWRGREVTDRHGASIAGEKMLEMFEPWELLSIVLDDNGVAVGIVARDLRTMKPKALAGDAVCLCTGDAGGVFARSTRPPSSIGTAAMAAFLQGAAFANAEMTQIHPTTLPAADKPRPLPERLRALGARLWVPRERGEKRPAAEISEKEREYFLERRFPELGSLAAADVASRALIETCLDSRRGLISDDDDDPQPLCYLDLSHLPRQAMQAAAGPSLEMIGRWTGEDPLTHPVRVGPAVHGLLGGLWVDFERASDGGLVADSPRNQATTIPGLYAAGDVEYQIHGANRIEANHLPSLLFAGRTAAAAIVSYQDALARSAFDLPSSVLENAETSTGTETEAREQAAQDRSDGPSPFELIGHLGAALTRDCGIRRSAESLARLETEIAEIEERAEGVCTSDPSAEWNQSAVALGALPSALTLARVVLVSATARRESRGVHHRTDHPEPEEASAHTTLVTMAGGRATVVGQTRYDSVGEPIEVDHTVDRVAPEGQSES